MRIPVKVIGLLLVAALLLTVAVACGGENGGASSSQQRKRSIQTRTDIFAAAEAKYPIPHPKNFPLREALVAFTEREDLLDHPWYVYIIADTGNILGYYVAKQVPVNSCTFLSSTENVRDDDGGNLILTAPSLDGIYYGGGGASAGCDEWFFFDGATDALIKIRGVKFFVADQPLKLQAEPIEVAIAE